VNRVGPWIFTVIWYKDIMFVRIFVYIRDNISTSVETCCIERKVIKRMDRCWIQRKDIYYKFKKIEKNWLKFIYENWWKVAEIYFAKNLFLDIKSYFTDTKMINFRCLHLKSRRGYPIAVTYALHSVYVGKRRNIEYNAHNRSRCTYL